MATKNCVPQKFRSDTSDEEVNQEVPTNYTGSIQKQPLRCCTRSASDPVWKLPRSPLPQLPPLPNSEASKEYNWQANMTSVREKNAVMYNNPLMADVHFTVGNGSHKQRIAAHKYVLATGSSVYYAMFYGGLADKHDEITLPDVEPVAFQNLLRYHSFSMLVSLRNLLHLKFPNPFQSVNTNMCPICISL